MIETITTERRAGSLFGASEPQSAPLKLDASWSIGTQWGAENEAPAREIDVPDLGASLTDALTFDEPASFSATAGEFKPRGNSLDAERPPHPLAEFFLPGNVETRSLAVLRSGVDADRIVQTASRYGSVSGVDDSFVALNVVFLQFDDARDAAAARATLAADLTAMSASGTEALCEGVIFGPAPRALLIAGLPPHTTAADVRAVFAANAYGDVATVRRWRQGDGGAFEVAFWARSAAERAALELSRSDEAVGRGGRVSVDYVHLEPRFEARDAALRDALDRMAREAPEEADDEPEDPWADGYSSLAPDAPEFAPTPAFSASAPAFMPRVSSDPYEWGEGSLPAPGMRRSSSDWTVGYGGSFAAQTLAPLEGGPPHKLRHHTRDEVRAQEQSYQFDADAANSGLDQRTTLMVRNIPNKYTQRAVLEEIDGKFARAYDFFYLPIDFKNKCNVGYAFINLCDPKDALELFQEFNGRRWTCFRSGKVCAITYARIQGKHMMIERFKNSSLLNESVEVQPRLFVSSGPDKGKPEQFPGGAPLPPEPEQPAKASSSDHRRHERNAERKAAEEKSGKSGGGRSRNRGRGGKQ